MAARGPCLKGESLIEGTEKAGTQACLLSLSLSEKKKAQPQPQPCQVFQPSVSTCQIAWYARLLKNVQRHGFANLSVSLTDHQAWIGPFMALSEFSLFLCRSFLFSRFPKIPPGSPGSLAASMAAAATCASCAAAAAPRRAGEAACWAWFGQLAARKSKNANRK